MLHVAVCLAQFLRRQLELPVCRKHIFRFKFICRLTLLQADNIHFLLRYLHIIYDFAVGGITGRFHSFSWTWTRMDIMDGMDTMDFPFDGLIELNGSTISLCSGIFGATPSVSTGISRESVRSNTPDGLCHSDMQSPLG